MTRCQPNMGLKLKTITQNQKVTIRVELFAHLRVMLLFFSWAICMIAFFMWMIYAAMPLFGTSSAMASPAGSKSVNSSRNNLLLPLSIKRLAIARFGGKEHIPRLIVRGNVYC